MNLPTLYHLIFKRNSHGEYDVYEQHTCQEKGCIWTKEEYCTTCLPNKLDEFLVEFNNELLDGVVDSIHVEYIAED